MHIIDYLARKPVSYTWAVALLLNVLIGVLDYLTGYEIGLGIFYLLPIGIVSWIIGRRDGIIMSVLSMVTIMYANISAGLVFENHWIYSWNIFVHLGFFLVVVYLISAEKAIADNNKELIDKLQKALDEIKTLSGLLPICSSCKKIRDDDGYWRQMEHYISEYTAARFSHSICPECKEKLYPGFGKRKNES
ncbi:MAG TPA: hypothetical protein VLZ07_11085 [Syntrophales bacterium]|nr:hypothetical protein [Syntrophales bacterium]